MAVAAIAAIAAGGSDSSSSRSSTSASASSGADGRPCPSPSHDPKKSDRAGCSSEHPCRAPPADGLVRSALPTPQTKPEPKPAQRLRLLRRLRLPYAFPPQRPPPSASSTLAPHRPPFSCPLLSGTSLAFCCCQRPLLPVTPRVWVPANASAPLLSRANGPRRARCFARPCSPAFFPPRAAHHRARLAPTSSLSCSTATSQSWLRSPSLPSPSMKPPTPSSAPQRVAPAPSL